MDRPLLQRCVVGSFTPASLTFFDAEHSRYPCIATREYRVLCSSIRVCLVYTRRYIAYLVAIYVRKCTGQTAHEIRILAEGYCPHADRDNSECNNRDDDHAHPRRHARPACRAGWSGACLPRRSERRCPHCRSRTCLPRTRIADVTFEFELLPARINRLMVGLVCPMNRHGYRRIFFDL